MDKQEIIKLILFKNRTDFYNLKPETRVIFRSFFILLIILIILPSSVFFRGFISSFILIFSISFYMRSLSVNRLKVVTSFMYLFIGYLILTLVDVKFNIKSLSLVYKYENHIYSLYTSLGIILLYFIYLKDYIKKTKIKIFLSISLFLYLATLVIVNLWTIKLIYFFPISVIMFTPMSYLFYYIDRYKVSKLERYTPISSESLFKFVKISIYFLFIVSLLVLSYLLDMTNTNEYLFKYFFLFLVFSGILIYLGTLIAVIYFFS